MNPHPPCSAWDVCALWGRAVRGNLHLEVIKVLPVEPAVEVDLGAKWLR